MQIQARLGGGKLGDPSLYIHIVDRKRGLLFDCGLNSFSHADLRRVTDLFISHTHIDHFIGFDTLLRLNLAEHKTLRIYGPPGIQHNVAGKLQAYTWNICQNLLLTIVVHEVHPHEIVVTEMKSHLGFQVIQTTTVPHATVLLDTPEFSVSYLQLDHKTPSFGYAFVEADSFNVQKDVLQALDLEPGPWLNRLKQQAACPETFSIALQVGDITRSVGEFVETLLVRKRGMKVTYLTDFLCDNASFDALSGFAWESDLLFCESAFSERDREKAHRTFHVTAREAGKLARLAHVRQLILFHISKRYQDYSLLIQEAKSEFPYVE
jgi:ribonuclease Z